LEREVASFLDEQSQLYFWYRNIPLQVVFQDEWEKRLNELLAED
jgi:hypothetical protein